MFHMYDKKIYKCDVTCSSPLPLPQTVTPSRTPNFSSVTYFMDGAMPICYGPCGEAGSTFGRRCWGNASGVNLVRKLGVEDQGKTSIFRANFPKIWVFFKEIF